MKNFRQYKIIFLIKNENFLSDSDDCYSLYTSFFGENPLFNGGIAQIIFFNLMLLGTGSYEHMPCRFKISEIISNPEIISEIVPDPEIAPLVEPENINQLADLININQFWC